MYCVFRRPRRKVARLEFWSRVQFFSMMVQIARVGVTVKVFLRNLREVKRVSEG